MLSRASVGGWSTLCLLDVDSRNPAATLLERGVVTGGLRADQPAKAEVPARDRQLLARVVDHLEKEPDVRAALVELPGRVQIPRPVTVRDDETASTAQLAHEVGKAPVVLLRRLDERLHTDVVVLVRLPKEHVDRAVRLDVGLLPRRKHLVRLVLRRLHVRLVERIDLEVRAGDRDRELPA